METWGVVGRFEEDKYEHGGEVFRTMTVRVLLTDGEAEVETARVAFNRNFTPHPEVSLGDALEAEVAKAERAAEIVNSMFDDEDRRRAQAVYETRERVREIMAGLNNEAV